MSIYVNPNVQAFEEAINSDIFVDKTEMLLDINEVVGTKQKYISVSRPRRFGKTMAADMICSYYGKSKKNRALFKERKLAQINPEAWDKYLGKYNVIRLLMTDFVKKDVTVSDSIGLISKRILDELVELYPNTKYDKNDLFFSLEKFYINNRTQFVIVIDEWDAVFRIRKEDANGQEIYLDFLRDLFKDRNYLALAYMTGILPIKKYGEHSALNMFDEYSMISPMKLAKYAGFTFDEVNCLCEKYNMDMASVKEWYDGYILSEDIPLDKRNLYREGKYNKHMIHIFGPLSVVKSMRSGIIGNYWNNTETYEALAEYIRMDFDGLRETITILMNGGRIKINISKYQNDMTTFQGKDDILTLLIHLGYLSYDLETEEVYIPNKEILEVFKDSTSDDSWSSFFGMFKKSKELVEATWNCDSDKVAELLENVHDRADNKTYNDETALSYAISYAFYAAQIYYTEIRELDTGKGYADIVFVPSPKYNDKPLIIVELKNGKSPEEAIEQIIKRNYVARFEHYKGNILAVGINYDGNLKNTDSKYKRHQCTFRKF